MRTTTFEIIALLLFTVAIPTHATIITVTNTNDSGLGSLRQALADANDRDIVDFDPSLNGQHITLTSSGLVIDKNITISGPGPGFLSVSSGATLASIFHVMPGHTVIIGGLTIGGNGPYVFEGGGIFNESATLTVSNCTVVANQVEYEGGGIFNGASGGTPRLLLLNSTVTVNSASNESPPDVGGVGGGIFDEGGFVEIINSTISDNFGLSACGGVCGGTITVTNSTITANRAGGGKFNIPGSVGGISGDTVTISNSTVSYNGASGDAVNGPGVGGGIYCGGTMTITNSTVSGNQAGAGVFQNGPGLGGGIYCGGTLTIENSTLSNNSATTQGGGIYNGGSVGIGNTILNTAGASGANIFNNGGTITSAGYNLSNDDGGGYLNGPGDQIDTDPLLGPLRNNGGPTFTHELLSGSPAIDAGAPNFIPPPFYDQRGPDFYRIRNDRIDIGSFEVQQGPAVTPTPTPTPRPIPTPRPRPSPAHRP
jgi:hypothetical protein